MGAQNANINPEEDGAGNSGVAAEKAAYYANGGKKTFWQKLGGFFTNRGVTVDENGTTIKTGTGFEKALNVLGGIISIFNGGTYSDPITGKVYQQDGTIYTQEQYNANVRKGKITIWLIIGGVGIVVLAVFGIRGANKGQRKKS